MIRTYVPADEPALFSLWNRAGRTMGYAPLTEDDFRRLLICHPGFSPEYTFLLEEKERLLGFVCGCTGAAAPRGDTLGYVSCLILEESADTAENTALLLSALEHAFRGAGRKKCTVSFFNPVHLPWVIPGTESHQHNNAPGVAVELPLYERMGELGYRETARECAMYLNLSAYETPAWVEEKAERMAQRGYRVARYDPTMHKGMEEMVASLGNPVWSREIPAAANAGMELLVGLKGNVCAGFTGPVYPEKTGRGYFAGLGVAPQYEGHGLGTLLFYRLLEREKQAGAQYMSLFTGEDNPALEIYRGAGFRVVRTFGVMEKIL